MKPPDDSGVVLCPRCGTGEYTTYESGKRATDDAPYPALSRVDNKTHICTTCGTDEAMRDFKGDAPIPPDEWPI